MPVDASVHATVWSETTSGYWDLDLPPGSERVELPRLPSTASFADPFWDDPVSVQVFVRQTSPEIFEEASALFQAERP